MVKTLEFTSENFAGDHFSDWSPKTLQLHSIHGLLEKKYVGSHQHVDIVVTPKKIGQQFTLHRFGDCT